MNFDFSIFTGGWSYTSEEIKNAIDNLLNQENIKVIEFGCGDSSIKLFNLLKNKYNKVEYTAYESNHQYAIQHDGINCFIYNETEIENLDIGNEKYDFILIDGPNGEARKFWYSKITNNVKNGTIILIDDWCHYEEFEIALVYDFGSKIKYEIIETRKEFDPNSTLGYKSWKLIKVISSN